MHTNNERLHQMLAGLSGSLTSLQQQIEQANQLLERAPLTPTALPSPSRSGYGSQRRSPLVSPTRIPQLERRVQELEANRRDLAENLEALMRQHGACQTEIDSAVRGKDQALKKYRFLARATADLLQKLIDGFPPDEDFDQNTRDAVGEDLKNILRSPNPSVSSGSGTARPVAGGSGRHSYQRAHSAGAGSSRVAPGVLSPVLGGASSRTSQLSPLSHSHIAERDGTLSTWSIHSGSKCPGSVRAIAGPFVKEDFIRLGIDKTELEDLFQGLIRPQDVGIRLATGPPLRGLENTQLLFLYDPFYLESGAGTYILDWVTPQSHEEIANWLESSSNGSDAPVFHTFTLSKKKKQWYYFGGMKWSVAWLDVWPTLGDSESRASILKKLSDRSHGALGPEEIGQQMADGELQELCIEIVSADDMSVMQEIGSRLGRSPKEVRKKRPVAHGEQ